MIERVNRARRDHPALQSNERLSFHPTGNDRLLAYTKSSEDRADVILAVVNFDYHARQSGSLELDLAALGLPAGGPISVVDLLDGSRRTWRGPRAVDRPRPGGSTRRTSSGCAHEPAQEGGRGDHRRDNRRRQRRSRQR